MSGSEPKPNNPVPSTVRRTTTTARGSSSAFSAKSPRRSISQDGVCEDHHHHHQGVLPRKLSGNRKRTTRKRAKPQLLDPSPPMPARKRGRGRPPGSGRKQRLVSWLTHQELKIGKDSRDSLATLTRLCKQSNINIPPSVLSEGNQSSPPTHNQLSEQNIHINTSTPIHQHKEQIPNTKKEPQAVVINDQPSVIQTCTTHAQNVQEITTTPPLREVPITTITSRYGHEREGACGLNNQLSPSSDVFMCVTANAFGHTGESNPAADGTTPQVAAYTVNRSVAQTLQAIINKHGDIAKDCHLESGYMRASVLEGICKVVQELQRKELTELDSGRLYAYHSAVKDAEKMKLNVKWLHQRLNDICDALKSTGHAENLSDQKTKRLERIEYMKKDLQLNKIELEKLKSEIEAKENQLALETLEIEKLNSTIRGITSKFQQFQSNSLMDGLL
uniref:Phospholipase-like protein n=1 Tax=Davidia involucrata TaxID=16924 RepID=A0A5B7BJX3_DAVIN